MLKDTYIVYMPPVKLKKEIARTNNSFLDLGNFMDLGVPIIYEHQEFYIQKMFPNRILLANFNATPLDGKNKIVLDLTDDQLFLLAKELNPESSFYNKTVSFFINEYHSFLNQTRLRKLKISNLDKIDEEILEYVKTLEKGISSEKVFYYAKDIQEIFTVDVCDNGFFNGDDPVDPLFKACLDSWREFFPVKVYHYNHPLVLEAKAKNFPVIQKLLEAGRFDIIADIVRIYILSKKEKCLYIDCDRFLTDPLKIKLPSEFSTARAERFLFLKNFSIMWNGDDIYTPLKILDFYTERRQILSDKATLNEMHLLLIDHIPNNFSCHLDTLENKNFTFITDIAQLEKMPINIEKCCKVYYTDNITVGDFRKAGAIKHPFFYCIGSKDTKAFQDLVTAAKTYDTYIDLGV